MYCSYQGYLWSHRQEEEYEGEGEEELEEVREGEMNIFLKLLKYILFKFALVSFHWILVQA